MKDGKWEELADKSYCLKHLLVWNTMCILKRQALIYFCEAVVSLETHHLVFVFPLSLLHFPFSLILATLELQLPKNLQPMSVALSSVF